jgi:phospholipid transport system substrate-binding protein
VPLEAAVNGEMIMVAKRVVALFVVILVFSIVSPSSASSGPTDQVRITVDGVMDILKDKTLDEEARRERLSSLIRKRFDFKAMSQRALGINWKKATQEEKEKFVKLFSDLLEATYIGRIEAYSDERVEYIKEKVEKNRAEVDTHIVTKSVEIPMRYKLILRGEEWLVYDVVIEEVSLIRNFRSTYREIVKKEGFSGLLAKMENKINKLDNSEEAKGKK